MIGVYINRPGAFYYFPLRRIYQRFYKVTNIEENAEF
nr:MAG TPA: hypothetical protein [Caudoviricetes sp.]